MKDPTVLVVDDDVQIRRALRHALAARGYEVMLAATGEEALDMAACQTPDMVVLDLNLPGLTGMDVCRELRSWSQVPILVLSVQDRPNDKVIALDLGADDYLTKPFDTAELLARIRSHLRRMSQLSHAAEAVMAFGTLRVDVARHQVFRGEQEVRLTKTEFALLQYLAQNAGRVVTYSLLLSKVWGSEYEADTQTLRVHIGNLRRKIEADANRPTFILTEPGVGYRFASHN